MQDIRDYPEVESEPALRRKSTEQIDSFQRCTSCVKENKSKMRCQSCGDAQRLCRQSTSSSESPASLARPSIHPSPTTDKSVNKGLNARNFYGSSYSTITMDSMLKNDSPRWKQCPPNGKIGLSAEANLSKITRNARLKSSRLSETNDTIILSSDDEDNTITGSTSRIESISPRPADSACSSPVPSSGKVEAALRENSFVYNKNSNPPEADPPVTIPRKARMKDQFGNPVATTPVKRRKVAQLESPSESGKQLQYSVNPCESMILECRNLRIGTFYRVIKEAVVVSIEEQYIVLIFERPLTDYEVACFEKILYDVGKKISIPNFLTKISFDEANRRLVAFTNNTQKTPTAPKDHITRSVTSESRMKLRNTSAQMQFFDDNEEEGDTHNVFVGPIEKLIVYPPPPAKGGISVTNEDLHCLNEGEFLNDVIIDFYLKYLILEKLRDKADRIHIFSSFFYKRLNQRERRNHLQEIANLTLQQRRHGRVKTWTRHVDIFQKDFIFVPLNEAAHWFLAVICFPGLKEPVYLPNRYYQENSNPSAAMTQTEDNRLSVSCGESQTCSSKTPLKKLPSKKQTVATGDTSSGTDDSDTPTNRQSHCLGTPRLKKTDQGLQESEASLKSPFPQTDSTAKNVNGIANECKTPLKHADGLHKIQISYSESPDDQKKGDEEFIDFSDDQDNLDESSDDGGLADDNFTSEAGKWHLKPLLCKQYVLWSLQCIK
ncbi:hypothetical protein GDO81_007896 [Engystomops pustulosus]|uniref:Ubiquitin-like protease family profile domain-containing protein n=1 Tax=Engystomops pustulosus TaxID=76066 RepID=A0AAV7CBI1_ENGPU|nr:hypothetical protein GDO81_007896 [Engystomops pustulosus]